MESHPFVVVEGGENWGEIVTWSAVGIKITHTQLVNALRKADLDETIARELAPRHAFSRACLKLSQARIIRQISDVGDEIKFQFTAERKEEERFNYDFEAVLTLNKITGRVSCDNAGLADLAQGELDKAIGWRTGTDVTRITQRLFDKKKADLFPIRDQGGVYFVAQMHMEFVPKINQFLDEVNAKMKRLPIAKGAVHGDRAVRESVAEKMKADIQELTDAIETFDVDTRPSMFERKGEAIKQLRFKLEMYSTYLGELKRESETALAMASLRLREKIENMAAEIATADVA